mgnify:CR=1 FL=1
MIIVGSKQRTVRVDEIKFDIKIYKLKKRPKSNPLIVHYSNLSKLKKDCFINDNFIKDGLFNASAARPLVRLGYMDYGVVGSENTFTKNRPKLGKDGKLQPIEEWDGVYR